VLQLSGKVLLWANGPVDALTTEKTKADRFHRDDQSFSHRSRVIASHPSMA
jgi:hypothetical protein